MGAWLAVACGGALGASTRYVLVSTLSALVPAWPFGTWLVNLLGSVLLGALVASQAAVRWRPELYLALSAGFAGGFTTYSAFNLEVLQQLRDGAFKKALLYLLLTVFSCLLGALLGMQLGRRLL